MKDGVLYDTLAGTVSADPELGQNIWYELEFYDDHVEVDQFAKTITSSPTKMTKSFTFRDHTAPPVCEPGEDCLAVAFAISIPMATLIAKTLSSGLQTLACKTRQS